MPHTVYVDREQKTKLTEDPDVVTHPVLGFFLDYWNAKRGASELPAPASFVPREVRGNLQWVTLVDVLPPDDGEFRYRLVGTRVADYFLGDGTGKTVRDAFAHADAGFVEGAIWVLRRTCELRRPLQLTAPASSWNKIYFPSFDSLYMPYSSDGRAIDRLISVFMFDRSSLNGRAASNTAA